MCSVESLAVMFLEKTTCSNPAPLTRPTLAPPRSASAAVCSAGVAAQPLMSQLAIAHRTSARFRQLMGRLL